MFQKLSLKDHPEVRRVIQAAAPQYRKREVYFNVEETVALTGTYWSEGSHYSYHAIELTTGRTVAAPQFDPPQFGGPRVTPRVAIPEGIAIVRTGTFCGKPATASIYICPANAAKLLPA